MEEGILLDPVCNPQSVNFVEVGNVVAYQGCADASRVGGDHHVHGADRHPFPFQDLRGFRVRLDRAPTGASFGLCRGYNQVMGKLNPFFEEKIGLVREVFRRRHVVRAFAFGSVCSDRFREGSDIDLLVSFDDANIEPLDYADNYLALADELESILGVPVDLVTERSLRNPYFIHSIQENRTPIYG
jgi:predicted nucleotidyltransferase